MSFDNKAYQREWRARKSLDPQWLEERRSRDREAKRRYLQTDNGRAKNAARSNAWYHANKDKAAETARQYRRKNSVAIREKRRLNKGIIVTRPEPEFCECCGGEQVGNKPTLCADHDHTTGDFRGWLCDPCNRAIGLLKDKPQLAVSYLERAK